MGAIDHTHASLANLRDDAVVAQQFADHHSSWGFTPADPRV